MIVAAFAMTLGLIGIDDAAALGRGDAYHEIEIVLFGQLRPAIDDMAVVLGWSGVARTVVHTIVIEKYAKDFMTTFQSRPGKQIRSICCLVSIGPFVNHNTELHLRFPHIIFDLKVRLRNGYESKRSRYNENLSSYRYGTW